MVVSSPTRVSFVRWPLRGQPSSTANTSLRGGVSRLLAKLSGKLCVIYQKCRYAQPSTNFSLHTQFLQFATEKYGRKVAFYTLTLFLTAV